MRKESKNQKPSTQFHALAPEGFPLADVTEFLCNWLVGKEFRIALLIYDGTAVTFCLASKNIKLNAVQVIDDELLDLELTLFHKIPLNGVPFRTMALPDSSIDIVKSLVTNSEILVEFLPSV